MRGIIPDFFSIVFSNLLIVIGTIFLYFGFAIFIKEKINKKIYYFIGWIFFVFYTYFGVVAPNLRIRLILLYMTLAFINFQSVRILYKNKDMKMQKNYKYTGGVMFFSAVFYLFILVYYIFKFVGRDYFESGMDIIFIIIVSQIVKISVTFSILMMVNKTLLVSLEEEAVKREKLLKGFRYLATVDGLTKLWNRETIEGKLRDEIFRSQRYNRKISLILLDIDNFKKVNDTYGHPTGDLVLRKLSEILKINLRKTDFIGRWGGEEFIIICIETDKRSVWKVSEKLRVSVEEFDFGIDMPITISLGNATLNKDENIDEVLKRVDVNMYKAKESGRNKTEPDPSYKNENLKNPNSNFEICDIKV
jgi:diguanylate cyclase (GGDEF)-like protein